MKNRRIEREKRTIRAMAAIYCGKNHGHRGVLCADCGKLLDYALQKLDNCPFREKKPACTRCTVHCYSPEMRERIRKVMRFAGPRMIFRHPVLAVLHLWDRLSRRG